MTIEEVTRLIDALKNLTQRNSITPQVVANIMQQIVTLIKKNGEADTFITDWYEYLKNEDVLYSISQGSADRNDIHIKTQHFFLSDGAIDTPKDEVIIKQATTERAGAMRAQQVIDLNACKKDIKTLESSISSIQSAIDELRADITAKGKSISTISTSISEIDNDLAILQSTCEGLETALDSIQMLKPWRLDFPARYFMGTVYNTNEAPSHAPDVYYSVAQKKFFMLRDDGPDYNIEHNSTDKAGLLAPIASTFYICNHSIYYWDGEMLRNYPTFEMYDALKDRVAQLESKL